ncbi:rhomboid family intramembrane serine protease [Rugosimonospora acidiphila]|uniref:Rhomboid family intramembrane serine protease n=1 Tax=Rugosimonospora acidiphila TaxID=556531 RepID=A0ABP9RWE9_9ACTN
MVIPVHDVLPVRRTPWITYLLIAINVVVFLLTPAARSTDVGAAGVAQLCQQESFYDKYSAIPVELTHEQPLARVPTGAVGVGRGGAVGCVVGPPSYHKIPALSVLYAMFLHGGWLHLLGNMLFLWVFGNNVEDRLGRLRYALFYLFCGYAATYGFALASPDSSQPLVGASGAIAGVLGAYLVLYPRARVWSLVPVLLFIPLRLPAWLVLGMWFVLQWVYSAGYTVSAAGSVAYLAHVVGFVVGALFALPLRGRRPPVGSGYGYPSRR